jgi:transposase-like protein
MLLYLSLNLCFKGKFEPDEIILAQRMDHKFNREVINFIKIC